MSVAVPVPDSPVVSVAQANPRMEAIDAALPAADGIACFNSPIQFALAGMNARINHDLPLAVVSTCQALTTAPDAHPHYADYQEADQLLDAAEQSVRESFETAAEVAA